MPVVKLPLALEGMVCYMQDTMVWAAVPDGNAVVLHLVTHSTPLPDLEGNAGIAPMVKGIFAQMLGERRGDLVPVRCSMANVCEAFHLVPFNVYTGPNETMPIGLQPGVITAVIPAFDRKDKSMSGSNLILMRCMASEDMCKVSVKEAPEEVLRILAVKPDDIIDLAGDFKGATHQTVIVSQ